MRSDRSPVAARVAVAAERLGVRLAGLGRQRRPVPAGEEQGIEVPGPRVGVREHRVAALEPLERGLHTRGGRRDRAELPRGGRRGVEELVTERLEVGRRRDRRQRRPQLAAGPQLAVGPEDRFAQPGAVRGDQLDPARRVLRELLERELERRLRERIGVGLVEHRELGIDPRHEGVGAQHPSAEAVDGRDVGPLGAARGLVGAEFAEPPADPVAELGGGLLGERDREDLRGVDAVLEHGAHEPLDEHRGLAAPGARVEQQVTVAPLDRRALLGGELGHVTRQIPG